MNISQRFAWAVNVGGATLEERDQLLAALGTATSLEGMQPEIRQLVADLESRIVDGRRSPPQLPDGDGGAEPDATGAAILDRTYKRNKDGEFSSGGGGAGGEEDVAEPVEPSVVASAKGGGHSVAKFDDPDGQFAGTTYEAATYVAVSEGGGSFGPRKGLDDADFVMPAEHAGPVADAIDRVAKASKTIPAPSDPGAFHDGPALVTSEQAGPYHVSVFHDGNGDMGDPGDRFVQITNSSSWRDSLAGAEPGERFLNVEIGDAPGVAGAIRKVANA